MNNSQHRKQTNSILLPGININSRRTLEASFGNLQGIVNALKKENLDEEPQVEIEHDCKICLEDGEEVE